MTLDLNTFVVKSSDGRRQNLSHWINCHWHEKRIVLILSRRNVFRLDMQVFVIRYFFWYLVCQVKFWLIDFSSKLFLCWRSLLLFFQDDTCLAIVLTSQWILFHVCCTLTALYVSFYVLKRFKCGMMLYHCLRFRIIHCQILCNKFSYKCTNKMYNKHASKQTNKNKLGENILKFSLKILTLQQQKRIHR